MLKPQKLKATYSMDLNRDLYEEIRIDEAWDQSGKAAHSDRYEEGFIWSELYGQSNEKPFDKWASNYDMCFQGGTGSIESFFENHFSQEKIRRKELLFLYPDEGFDGSIEDYRKGDPRVSWLYYKRSFDAVFPVLCELGRIHLEMELEAVSDDGRMIRFLYSTGVGGEIYTDEKYLLSICFYDERYSTRYYPQSLDIGRPKKQKNGKMAATLYGVYSFSDLLSGLETAAKKALFYEGQTGGDTKARVYRLTPLFNHALAERTELTIEDLIKMGAKKLAQPEVGGRKIALFYWNYDKSVKTLGGYAEQAAYPDAYFIKREEDNAEDQCYLVFDGLQDLEGWYPLDRFRWEDDPEPKKEADLRRIILDPLALHK